MKLAKFEKFVEAWNDFDQVCRHMDGLFVTTTSGQVKTNLEV
jgi:hypothetical protein